MAYDRRKIIVFGVGGVVIAAFLIFAFLPVREEVAIRITVVLQEIPGYGFQIVKMSEKQANVVNLRARLTFNIRQIYLIIGSTGEIFLEWRPYSFSSRSLFS
jgi:hypothetical protein